MSFHRLALAPGLNRAMTFQFLQDGLTQRFAVTNYGADFVFDQMSEI